MFKGLTEISQTRHVPLMMLKLEHVFPHHVPPPSEVMAPHVDRLPHNRKWFPLYELFKKFNYVDRFDMETLHVFVNDETTDEGLNRFDVLKDVEYVLNLASFLMLEHLSETVTHDRTVGSSMKLPEYNLAKLFPKWKHPTGCETTVERLIKTVIWNEQISETLFSKYFSGHNGHPVTEYYYFLLYNSSYFISDVSHNDRRLEEFLHLTPHMWKKYLHTKPTITHLNSLYYSDVPFNKWHEYKNLPSTWVKKVVR